MARGVNKAILVGNLGQDPEVRYTQGGMAIASFSVATTSVRKDRDGNSQEKTEWHRVKAFGKLGELVGEYLAKGRQVYVEGRISYSQVEGEGGTVRYFTDIIADELQFLGGGGQDAGGGGGYSRGSGGGRQASSGRSSGGRQSTERETVQRESRPRTDLPADGFSDDDIPF